jgi:hypothetical protein
MVICCLIEAIDAILLHSATPESLLLRKRLSREILFRYLHNKKVPTIPTDKRTMISKILQMWNCTLHDNEVIISNLYLYNNNRRNKTAAVQHCFLMLGGNI